MKGAAKGVLGIKLGPDDSVLAFTARDKGAEVAPSGKVATHAALRPRAGRACARKGGFETWKVDVSCHDPQFGTPEGGRTMPQTDSFSSSGASKKP